MLRAQFAALDQSQRGAIRLQELKTALAVGDASDDRWIEEAFAALCSVRKDGAEDEVRYSDFLAAMIPAHVVVNDSLLRSAFRKFDTEGNGAITVHDLERLLGSDFEGTAVEELIREADTLQNGAIHFPEFAAVVRRGQQRRHIATAHAPVQLPRPTLLGMHGSCNVAKDTGIKSRTGRNNFRSDPFLQDASCSDKDSRSCSGICLMQ